MRCTARGASSSLQGDGETRSSCLGSSQIVVVGGLELAPVMAATSAGNVEGS